MAVQQPQLASTPSVSSRVKVWSNTAVQSGYVHEKNGVKSGFIEGVMSMYVINSLDYDHENYRDGNQDFSNDGDGVVLVASALEAKMLELTNPDPNGATPTPTKYDLTLTSADSTHVTKSASDAVMHVPPRNEMHQETFIELWSDASAAVNCLYSGKLKNFESWEVSKDAFKYIS